MDPPSFRLFSSLRYDEQLLNCPANHLLDQPSPYYMLSHHRDRILQAAEHFQWIESAASISGDKGLSRLQLQMDSSIDKLRGPLRVKVLLDHEGTLTVESSPIAPVALENLFPAQIPPPERCQDEIPEASSFTRLAVSSRDSHALPGMPDRNAPWIIIPDFITTLPSSYTTYKTTSRDMYDTARTRALIQSMTERKEVLIISEKGGEIMEGSLTSVFFWRDGQWVTPPIASGGQAGTTRRWLIEQKLCRERVIRKEDLVDGEECWISNGVRGLSWGNVGLGRS